MNIFGYDTNKAFDYENGFYLTSEPKRLQKLLNHYELYQKIKNLPGEIIELGVFKGASLIRFASFRDSLETTCSRKIIGFDAFGNFPIPQQQAKTDHAFIEKFTQVAGSGISKSELEELLHYKGFRNIELIAGDIMETLPEYLKQQPQLRIALLHIDVDVFAPSKLALDSLYPHMVRGGLIVVDDYGTVEGETLAVDEFIHKHNLKLQKLPLSNIPAYIEVI
jgi:hypothetical protein